MTTPTPTVQADLTLRMNAARDALAKALQAQHEAAQALTDAKRALLEERDALRKALTRILENEASDWKAAEEFGGYVLDDELREEARAALAKGTP